MSKKRKVKLICISAVLLVVLCVVGVLIGVANSQNDHSKPTQELSQWMSMIKDDTLLKKIVIPGAHDAGTVGLPYLAETQDRSMAEMLACGTRYFDLRVTKAKDGKLKIFHGPFKGVTLDSVLEQVTQFLDEHDTETLILDFHHFENGAEQETKTKVLNLPVIRAQGDFVQFVDELTLGEARGKCLILWGPDSADGEVFLRRNNDEATVTTSALQSYYEGKLNKKSSSTYVKEVLPYYIDLYKQHNSGLFVLQAQLTDGLFVFGPHFREATHNKNMNKYVTDLQNSPDLDYINIIMRDYVSSHKNCLALQLNVTKGYVATEHTAAFQQMIDANTK